MTDVVSNLTGKLLLAMPGMQDPRFYHSVIFMCSHNEDGAMGLIINQSLLNLTLGQLLSQLKITPGPHALLNLPVQTGGPVESGRGFLLHGADFHLKDTMQVGPHFGVTATVDALQEVAQGTGPSDLIFMLGYAGWDAGQLEQEIQDNAWMVGEADQEIIFNTPLEQKWDRALARLGVDPGLLSSAAGHA